MDCACGRDSHRGREGQKEGHKGNMKVVRTDRLPSPSHFLESSKTLATLSDLCDLCVSLSFHLDELSFEPLNFGNALIARKEFLRGTGQISSTSARTVKEEAEASAARAKIFPGLR